MKRTDIQALRGFSVLVVLLFHLQISIFKGGFLGVDIFFVLSGFVITQRLAHGEGSFRTQITDFYRRRAKRILPASLFVILLTALLTRIFLAPSSFTRFGLDGLATTFFAGNIRFAAQGNNYLNQSMSPTPYLHYWSLGVEEQFYLIWPILFLLFVKRRKFLVVPLFLGATLFALWFTRHSPVSSFYLPTSRAFEFLAGITIALLPMKVGRFAKLLALCGWVAVLTSVLVIGSNTAVPGMSTLIPVAGVVAILIARSQLPWERAFAWLGDYSFSIYLIHWPLVVIALDRYQTLSVSAQVAIASLSLTGGYLIARLIENPFRFNKRFALGLPAWSGALIATGAIIFGVTSFAPAQASASFSIDLSEPIIYKVKCHLDFGISKPATPCLFGDLSSKSEVVLVGDSHAAQWFNALESVARNRHWKILSLTKSSCPAALMPTLRNGVADTSCSDWQRYTAARIKAAAPSKVFVTAFSEYDYPLINTKSTYAQTYADAQSRYIAALGLPASSIYYIEDTPRPTQSIPDCLSKNLKSSKSWARCDFPLKRSAATAAISRSLARSGVHLLDFNALLCPNGVCTATFKGHNTYRDASHISVSTSRALAPELSKLVP